MPDLGGGEFHSRTRQQPCFYMAPPSYSKGRTRQRPPTPKTWDQEFIKGPSVPKPRNHCAPLDPTLGQSADIQAAYYHGTVGFLNTGEHINQRATLPTVSHSLPPQRLHRHLLLLLQSLLSCKPTSACPLRTSGSSTSPRERSRQR